MKLKFPEKPTAWMIKDDGTEIPVANHIDTDIYEYEIDEILRIAYFLWKYAPEKWTPVCRFFDWWTYATFSKRLKSRIFVLDEVIAAIKQYSAARPYPIFPEEFAEKVACCSFYLMERGKGKWVNPRPPVKQILIDMFNQRFLRVRYGGKYETIPDCRDIFFRVSSVAYDWFPIIRSFVEKQADIIETVTIIKDFNSTCGEKYYMDSDKRPYNKIPVNDFLAGRGKTVPADENQDEYYLAALNSALQNGIPHFCHLCVIENEGPEQYKQRRRKIERLHRYENEYLSIMDCG